MKVHSDITHLPSFRNAVVTIGTFDGVHLGHRKIISQLISEAKRNDGESIIITFNPHPRKILSKSPEDVKLLTTISERIALLEQLGLDHLVIVPFDMDFANLPASAYVEDFLLKKFNPATLIIGYDHRFGKGRTGDFKLLEDYAHNHRFTLIEISEHVIKELKVSSTRIREELLHGKIEQARELLGYSYFFEGTVVKGDQLGRRMGYPTANLRITEPEKLVPGNGVYAVFAGVKETGSSRLTAGSLKGMMNIGVRPTVGGLNRVVEVNLFDFNDDIYDRQLQVYVERRLRDEQKFPNLDALQVQLAEDARQAERYFALLSA